MTRRARRDATIRGTAYRLLHRPGLVSRDEARGFLDAIHASFAEFVQRTKLRVVNKRTKPNAEDTMTGTRRFTVPLICATLTVAVSGCATTRSPREVALDDCRARAGRELGWRYDASVNAWRPEIGGPTTAAPGAPIPGLRERLNACMAARGIWNVTPQYQGELRFETSGTVLPLRVWLVNAPGAPFVGSYRTQRGTYGDFRITFEGAQYRGSLDASDGSRCDVRGDTDESRARLTGSFVCSPRDSGTLDLRRL